MNDGSQRYTSVTPWCHCPSWTEGLFAPFDYLVLSAMHNGMSMTMAYNLIPIMNGASFFGRTIPNGLADKYGRFNVFIIIPLALWLPGRSNAANIVFAALFGIGSGTTIGLTLPLVMTLYPPQEIGFRIGLALAIAGIGTLTSPPIAGAIAETDGGSFLFTALFSGVNFMVATWQNPCLTFGSISRRTDDIYGCVKTRKARIAAGEKVGPEREDLLWYMASHDSDYEDLRSPLALLLVPNNDMRIS